MPYFPVDDIEVEVSEFLYQCSDKEIKEVINYLVDNGYTTEEEMRGHTYTSPMEEAFENDVVKLHESYHILSSDDIDTIHRIAKKL